MTNAAHGWLCGVICTAAFLADTCCLAADPEITVALARGIQLEARYDASYVSSKDVSITLTITNQSHKPFVLSSDAESDDLLVPTYTRKRSVMVPHIGYQDYIPVEIISPNGDRLQMRSKMVGSRSHGELLPGMEHHFALNLGEYCEFTQTGLHQCYLGFEVQELAPAPGEAGRFVIKLPPFRFRVDSIAPKPKLVIPKRPPTLEELQKRLAVAWLVLVISGVGLCWAVVSKWPRKSRPGPPSHSAS